MSPEKPVLNGRENCVLFARWKDFGCGQKGEVNDNRERLKFAVLQVIHLPSFRSQSLLGSFDHSFLSASRHIGSESGL